MHRSHLVAIAAALLVVSAACSSSEGSDPPATSGTSATAGSGDTGGSGPTYVALGDSYTAGPQISPTDARSEACLRSTKNYPHLVAKAIGAASFTDVSCSGATSDNILETTAIPGTTTPVDAQIDAVTDTTELVTVGIGGNDSGLFSSLSAACVQQGTACEDYLEDEVPAILRSTRTHVVDVLEAIAQKAPDAEVVLVGYLGVTPDGPGCDLLGGAALDARGVHAGEAAIDAMMAAAARAGGASYVSMNAASEGHDACAGDEAWTNGLTPALGDGASLHPRAVGMEAVADAVEKAVDAA